LCAVPTGKPVEQACGDGWPVFSGAFHTSAPPHSLIRGPGCSDKFGGVGGNPPNVALCCTPVVRPPCPVD
jgi:hypothetical protein